MSIDADEDEDNFEGEELLYISTTPRREALIDFELPAEFPPEAEVESARLRLYSELEGESAFTVHRIAQAWDSDSVTWEDRPEAMMGAEKVAEQGEFEVNIPEITQRWVEGSPAYGLSLRTNNSGELRLRAIEGGFSPSLQVSLSW